VKTETNNKTDGAGLRPAPPEEKEEGMNTTQVIAIAACVQAVSTFVLVLVTAYYAKKPAKIAEDQNEMEKQGDEILLFLRKNPTYGQTIETICQGVNNLTPERAKIILSWLARVGCVMPGYDASTGKFDYWLTKNQRDIT
jgi:hypothetical protein